MAAGVFLCADYPDRPLFIVDHGKCTNVLLSTVAAPSAARPAVREVTIRIEAEVPGSRDRYRLSDIRARVNCADLSVALLSATDFNRAGAVVRRQRPAKPVAMTLKNSLQVKAVRTICSRRLAGRQGT